MFPDGRAELSPIHSAVNQREANRRRYAHIDLTQTTTIKIFGSITDANVRCGSKSEELSLSKCLPVYS